MLAAAAQLPPSRANEVLALVDLAGAGRRRVRGFSLGMRQRLSLAAALLGDPELVILGNPRERLDQAREKSRQIDRLVTNLFDYYARADIDQHPRLQATDLTEAVKSATAAIELAADERGVELRLTARTSPQVAIDPDGFDRTLARTEQFR